MINKSRSRKSPLRKRSLRKSRSRKSPLRKRSVRKSRSRKSPLRKRSVRKSRSRKSPLRNNYSPRLKQRSRRKISSSSSEEEEEEEDVNPDNLLVGEPGLVEHSGLGEARPVVARPAVARPAVVRPAVARPAVVRPAVARPAVGLHKIKRVYSDDEDEQGEPVDLPNPPSQNDLLCGTKCQTTHFQKNFPRSLISARQEWTQLTHTYKDHVDLTRNMIKFIINTYHRSDDLTCLMPSERASYILREFNTIDGFINPSILTNTNWMRLMGDGKILWGVVTANGLYDIKRLDQQTRARAIVDTLIKLNLKHICLMDGHGRMIYEIFSALQEKSKNIDAYRIDVYDSDGDVYEWHKLFFPENVFSFHKNIFESVTEDFKGILYMNFCNLSNNKNIQDTVSVIDTLTNRGLNVFVGLSRRNIGKFGKPTMRARFLRSSKKFRGKSHIFNNSVGKRISKAKDYLTFEYTKHEPDSDSESESEQTESEQTERISERRAINLAIKRSLEDINDLYKR